MNFFPFLASADTVQPPSPQLEHSLTRHFLQGTYLTPVKHINPFGETDNDEVSSAFGRNHRKRFFLKNFQSKQKKTGEYVLRNTYLRNSNITSVSDAG